MITLRPVEESAYAEMLRGGLMVMELNDFIWVPYERSCWQCSEPCTWVDLSFEAPLHPGPCSERAWDEYRWAELGVYLRRQQWE